MKRFFELLQNGDLAFNNPYAFALLVPGVLFALLILVRRREPFFATFLRLLGLAALCVALANPFYVAKDSAEELHVLFDLSASVSEDGLKALADRLTTFLKRSEIERTFVTGFARDVADQPFEIKKDDTANLVSDLRRVRSRLDTGDSNLEQGLRSVTSSNSLSSLLLLSDGLETSGEVSEVAPRLGASGVRVFPLIPDPEPFSDRSISVSSLYAPLVMNSGEKGEARVSFRNGTAIDGRGTLDIWLDREKILSRNVVIPAGQEEVFTVVTPALTGGLKNLRASLKVGSKELDRTRWISVKERQKIVMLNGDKNDERVLAPFLRSKGYSLEAITGEAIRRTPVDLSTASLVMLNNVSAAQLPASFLESLESFVSRGGGALLLGGERSFGLGGYINTPLEKLSPVKFVPPQTTKRRLNSAVILVIDKSRSMNEDNRIGAARRAAISSINALQDDDFVGVIGFDAAPFAVIRLAPVPEVKAMAERRLEHLIAAGNTLLLPALGLARQSLEANGASRKHVIVLTDGELPDKSTLYDSEIARMRSVGITVSTVGVGLEADAPFLKYISQIGGGAFYQSLDPSRLPEIFIQDIKVSTGERTLRENDNFPVAPGSGGISSTTLRSFPVLKGFVETTSKPEALVELSTSKEQQAFPILASWDYGQGKVAAYTSDANGRWSDRWIAWDGFPKFWGEVIESIRDKVSTARDLEFDLRYRVDRRNVALDLSVFDPKLSVDNAPRVTATLIAPGGEQSQVSFDSIRTGRFLAEIPNGKPGDYRVNILYGRTAFPPIVLSLSGDAFGERQGKGIDINKLSELARVTGGTINPSANQVAAKTRSTEAKEYLFFQFALLGFLALIIEPFIREGAWRGWNRRRRRKPTPSTPQNDDFGSFSGQQRLKTVRPTAERRSVFE